MAQKREIILNCGNSHVSANAFSLNNDGVLVEESYMETLHRDLTNDDLWMDATITALESISSKVKGNVRVILPGSMLISKTIRVPHVEPEKQRKIISFELSQKMPLPLSELIWDYLVIDDDGVEEEILAFAVKPEIVEKFCDKLVKLGLNPIQITPAPVLDYLAVKESARQMGEDHEILSINIGAKSTNLLFINPTGYLIRTIAIGGNVMSQNISDSLGITFEKAESLKKAYFAQEIKLAENDPAETAISTATNQFLARASQEITRSIVTYKRLKKGKSPSKILLMGRGALLPNLAQYLYETQQIEVQYYNPLIGVSFSEKIPENMRGLFPFMLGESIGLAKSALIESDARSKEINLLPQAKIQSIGFKQKTPILILSSFLICLLPLPFIWKSLEANQQYQKQKDKIDLQARELQNELSVLEGKKDELEFIRKFSSEVQKLHQPFITSCKSSWLAIEIINYVQGIIDNNSIGDVWLDSFDLNEFSEQNNQRNDSAINEKKYRLILSGRYLVRPNIEEDQEVSTRDILIELDREKKESLTDYLEGVPYSKEITRKTFSIEGKGDLFNRYFSHFEYEILIDTK
mgnify:CR=1 FL=1